MISSAINTLRPKKQKYCVSGNGLKNFRQGRLCVVVCCFLRIETSFIKNPNEKKNGIFVKKSLGSASSDKQDRVARNTGFFLRPHMNFIPNVQKSSYQTNDKHTQLKLLCAIFELKITALQAKTKILNYSYSYLLTLSM